MRSLLILAASVGVEAHMSLQQPAWNPGYGGDYKQLMECQQMLVNTTGTKGLMDMGAEWYTQNKTAPNRMKTLVSCFWRIQSRNFWFSAGTQIGCPAVTGVMCNCITCGPPGTTADAACCDKPMEPTNSDPKFLGFNKPDASHVPVRSNSNSRFNPWRAPGFAPVLDPCGVVGGYSYPRGIVDQQTYLELYLGGETEWHSMVPTKNHSSNGGPAPDGMTFPAGTKGSDVFYDYLHSPFPEGTPSQIEQPVTEWTSGGEAEVVIGALQANHAGGYMFRLCKASEFTSDGQKNEECMQRTPLFYASENSWIQWGDDAKNRTAFKATRVDDSNTKGVKPKGSVWTKNPVPNCAHNPDLGAECGDDASGKSDMQFEPVDPNHEVWGYGFFTWVGRLVAYATDETAPAELAKIRAHYDFQIVEKVKVPEVEGRYVLSWRWDAQQTPQIWTNCAIVDIKKTKALI